jgi:[acyl-carrier-protein] S-malonyltransferase
MMAHDVDTFVEIGPRQVLSSLIKRISTQARSINLTDAEVVRLLMMVDAGDVEAP